MKISELLEKHIPDEMKEYAHAPWEYSVIGPTTMNDEAAIYVRLDIGATKKRYTLTFNVKITEVEVTQTHITCPKFKS